MLDETICLYSQCQMVSTENGSVKVVTRTSTFSTVLSEFPDLNRHLNWPDRRLHSSYKWSFGVLPTKTKSSEQLLAHQRAPEFQAISNATVDVVPEVITELRMPIPYQTRVPVRHIAYLYTTSLVGTADRSAYRLHMQDSDFNTLWLFEFLFPLHRFGLRNAGQIFQRFMDEVTHCVFRTFLFHRGPRLQWRCGQPYHIYFWSPRSNIPWPSCFIW